LDLVEDEMNDDGHLDGNALAGFFVEIFGQEMTEQHCCCGDCGTISMFGEVHVYRDAPGDVMRCPACHHVLMVIVGRESGYRMSFESLKWVEAAPQS
jgi:hypothetical protein